MTDTGHVAGTNARGSCRNTKWGHHRTVVNAAFVSCLIAGAVTACSSADTSDTSRVGTAVSAATAADGNPGHLDKGRELFFHEFPGSQGNGRACADCHVESDAFTLTPQTVESRYQAMIQSGTDDPLFRSIDADDGANDYTTLRTKALIRVTIQLPPTIRMYDDPTATTVTLLRAVPTIQNVAYTAPYQYDGRKLDLQSQALGALHDHAQIQHDPIDDFLDDVAGWEKLQLSSDDPTVDPPLDETEQQGRQIFNRSCATCHSGPVLGTVGLHGFPQFLNILVSGPRPPGFGFRPSTLPVQRFQVKNPDGTWNPTPRLSTDPGRALISGNVIDFGSFDIPQLRGISKTAPYFHDNSAATLEDVVSHYVAFFNILSRLAPSNPFNHPVAPDEIPPLLAYLRKI